MSERDQTTNQNAGDWEKRASCQADGIDSLIFDGVKVEDIARARRICKTCPVVQECLEDALKTLDSEDYGIRGGTTKSERRVLRADRRKNRQLY